MPVPNTTGASRKIIKRVGSSGGGMSESPLTEANEDGLLNCDYTCAFTSNRPLEPVGLIDL